MPPLNLLGDYGGGSLYLVMGILAALHEARRSGLGQVVDAAITDGVVNLMAQFIGQSQRGAFVERRESNMLDGGWPWYGVYETADGPHVSVGPLEPQFFARLCELDVYKRQGVPDPVAQKLSSTIAAAVRRPEVSKFLTDRIVEPWGSTQEELGRTIEGEIAQWGPIVKKFNITV